jgi:hypothetical protein
MMNKFLSLAALIIFSATGQAAVIINDFTTGPVGTFFGGATTVQALGVTFGFSSVSGATYGDTIGTASDVPGTNFSDPVLDGSDQGTLTLTFDTPTTFVSFDVLFAALNATVNGGNAGGQVAIGATNCSFGTTGGQGSGGIFSIGSFNSTGCVAAPFTTATVTFSVNPASELTPGNTMFAIDNLSDTTSSSSTPEPSSVFLVVAIGLAWAFRSTVRRSGYSS